VKDETLQLREPAPPQKAAVTPNNALLTDAFSSLRWVCGAAKRER